MPEHHTVRGLPEMLDITQPEHGVEIVIKNDESVIWVNVDGICRLRVCRIPKLVVHDMRD